MKLRAGISLLGLLFMAITLSSCNIFSWTSSPDEGEDLLEEGLDFMFDGDFDAAESLFALGLLTDSLNSDLLYNHAKATLLSSGESIVTILEEIAKFGENSAIGSSLEVPFLGRPWPEEQDTLYTTNITIFKDLKPIFDERTTGSIKKEDISLDIFIANTVRGIMRIADTNGDGTITDPEDFQLSFLSNDSGFAFDDLSGFLDNPDDLNNLISNMGSILEGGGDLLGGFLGETPIDTSAIDSLLDDIIGSVEFYYVNTDTADTLNLGFGNNDGDRDALGVERIDEECLDGFDQDGDGLVDEDAVARGLIPGWPPGNTTPCP